MALSQDGYNFGSDVYAHGEIVFGPWEQPIKVGRFPGLAGEVHLIDYRKGRELSCQYLITGLASRSDLEVVVAAINDRSGTLTGTLTVTGAFALPTLPQCTFVGFIRSDIARPSGFGTWQQFGRLEWVQRSP